MTEAQKKAHEAISNLKCDVNHTHAIFGRIAAHEALDAAVEEVRASALQESGYWDSQGKIKEALASARERALREVARLIDPEKPEIPTCWLLDRLEELNG